MSQTCETCKEQLPLYIDGACTEAEAEAIREHLSVCEACQKEEAFLRSISATAKTLPGLAVTEDFRLRLQNRLEQEAAKPKSRVLPLWKKAAGFTAAAAVIAISVFTFGNLPETDIAPPQDITSQAVQGETAQKENDISVLADTARLETKDEEKSAGVPASAESQETAVQPRFTYATKGVLHYTFDEAAYHQAETILSNCEFDGTGYKVPVDDIVSVCEKLEDLVGYVGHRPSSDSPEAETEEEKELYNSFVCIIIEKV